MKTKEKIAVKQFKKSEGKNMDKKRFEKEFEQASRTNSSAAFIRLKDRGRSVIVARYYIFIGQNHVALYSRQHEYVGHIALRSIREMF